MSRCLSLPWMQCFIWYHPRLDLYSHSHTLMGMGPRCLCIMPLMGDGYNLVHVWPLLLPCQDWKWHQVVGLPPSEELQLLQSKEEQHQEYVQVYDCWEFRGFIVETKKFVQVLLLQPPFEWKRDANLCIYEIKITLKKIPPLFISTDGRWYIKSKY